MAQEDQSPECFPVRILIADPDAYHYSQLGSGFKVVTVSSGLECLVALREEVPDVLVLEPQLLWGGGAGVLALVSETPAWTLLLVMVLTSCREVAVLKTIAPYRICDYRVKPIASAELAVRIQNVLAFRQQREAMIATNAPAAESRTDSEEPIPLAAQTPCVNELPVLVRKNVS